ncbi:hypothetical protein [Bradyrhizobium sp. CCBAU 53421]|uniref:hypothetical protein n=1 Tax=Bradyrhizobium sp. CCBAU 53421 TaxID=1325120 RepID=UPI00188B0F4B|nr:hypothetical protein [Bradyrhizobium sp. CCBAU 53421]
MKLAARGDIDAADSMILIFFRCVASRVRCLILPKRDEIGLNHHRALAPCLSMIFLENRFTLFRIML